MLKAQGISVILKSLEVKFKRPVTFPDTVKKPIPYIYQQYLRFTQLLIAHKAYYPEQTIRNNIRTEFNLHAKAFSYTQGSVVAECDCTLVWYDYDALKKCEPWKEAKELLDRLVKEGTGLASS